MGAPTSLLGLILQIDADSTNADQAVLAFAQRTGQSVGMAEAQVRDYNSSLKAAYDEAVDRTRNAGDQMDTALMGNRESVRLLSEEMGIHLPRAVSGAIAGMLPGIKSLGGALLGAFALEQLPKFISMIHEAATELGGYTEAVRAAEKEDIAASNAALIHFTTIAQGATLVAQTNAALANLASKQGSWTEMAKAAVEAQTNIKSGLMNLLGPIGSAINLYRGYEAAVKESSTTEDQAAALRKRLVEQLSQLTKLQVDDQQAAARAAKEASAERARADKQAAQAAKQHAEELVRLGHAEAQFNEELVKERVEAEKHWARIQAEEQRELEKALKESIKALNQSGLAAAQALPPLTALGTGAKQLTEAERAALPLSNDLGLAIQREALRLREMRQEMDGGTLPAVKRIDTAYHKQMDTARQQLQLMQQEYQQHKITRAEMEASEEAYTQIVVDSAAIRTAAMKQEMLQQASTLATALGLEQEFIIAEAAYMIPKNLADGFSKLGETPPNYWAATQYFLSAAQWGVAAGKAVNTIAGGGGSSAGASSSSAASSSAASRSSSGGAAQQQTTNSVIRVELPSDNTMLPASYVRSLINAINTQTQYNNVTLHATYSRSLARRA